MPSRRRFLRASAVTAGAWAVDGSALGRLLAQAPCQAGLPAGELLETLPVTAERPRTTVYGELRGAPGLDRRRFTDISGLTPDNLITPSDRIFLRTDAPPGIADRAPRWQVALGAGDRADQLGIDALRGLARPMGAHLIECAGNTDPNNFGLLSVAEWGGVPLADVVSRLSPGADAWGVLVTGEDHEASLRASVPGASWILPLADLPRLGAFLATEMNGQPLPPDHGAPVRLVVPGWYGCSWIKWVRQVSLVPMDAPVTLQMAEYASRTHQGGRPMLAREYLAPTIDLAATPIRVERRRVNGAIEHHVVGIVWGGTAPVTALEIRFGARDAWQRFDLCPPPATARTWSVWRYRWTPSEPGTYTIALRYPDASVSTRRLDMFFYSRRVRIDTV
jgi:DMSO/TMAO reductase YedYZ molybdopterin-dependent catalytic subunit